MKFLNKLSCLLFTIPFSLFFCLIIALSLLLNGISYSPQTERLFLVSQDIFHNPFNNQITNQWLLASFLAPTVGYFTGLNKTLWQYSLMHLAIFLVFFPILIFAIRNKIGDFQARCISLLFFLTPLANVLLTWIGTPDIITVLLTTSAVVFPVLSLPTFFLMGINHFEQGIVILALTSLFFVITQRKYKYAIFGLSGIVVGKFLLTLFFIYQRFNITFTRLTYASNVGISRYLHNATCNPLALLFSLFGVAMVFVLFHLNGKKSSQVFIACSVLAFIVTLFVLDQTRVFSILTFPLLTLWIISPDFQEKRWTKNLIVFLLILGLFIPHIIFWDGQVYYFHPH